MIYYFFKLCVDNVIPLITSRQKKDNLKKLYNISYNRTLIFHNIVKELKKPLFSRKFT